MIYHILGSDKSQEVSMKPKISIIAVVGKNLAIGKNNHLLWNIPQDLKHFKAITKGHVVIMGSKTFESLGKPLPERTNIVVAKDEGYICDGCIVAHCLDEAFKIAKEKEEIFIIGGGSIYKQTIGLADKLYLTVVEDSPEADTFFPDYSSFSKVVSEEKHEFGNLKFKYLELTK